MNTKTLAITLILLLIGTITIGVAYFYNENGGISFNSKLETPELSKRGEAIMIGDVAILSIDDDTIFNFFKIESQLCDESNVAGNDVRNKYCTDKEVFKDSTRFHSITVSLDNKKIGFEIESDVLEPDKVVGIFYPNRKEDNIQFLTNYYLDNQFISFSPNDEHFAYRGNCWEAKCGLYILDSETLEEKLNINDPEFLDERIVDAEFVSWVSDNEVEYKLGEEIKRESF